MPLQFAILLFSKGMGSLTFGSYNKKYYITSGDPPLKGKQDLA